MLKALSKNETELLSHIIECDGAELPKDWWPEAEHLRRHGLIRLSGKRGPQGYFRRATPTKIALDGGKQ